MLINAEEVVSRVDGLNSTSTLRNWTSEIEKVSPHKFKRVGRVNYTRKGGKLSSSQCDYTMDDVIDFQVIADLKSDGMRLSEAIEEVFGSKHKQRQKRLEERLKELEESNKNTLGSLNDLVMNYSDLKRQFEAVERENRVLKTLLDEVVEYLETRKISPFKRSST